MFEQFRAWLNQPVIAHLNSIGEAMAIQQSDLDAIAAGLVSTEGSIQQAIAQLQADIDAGNSLDLSGIQNAAAGLAALVPSTTGGGEGPISDNPDAPVVDGGDTPAEPTA